MQSTRLNKLLTFLSSSPNDPFILYALATEYNSLKNAEQAFHYYLQLVEQHPSYVGTYYHLGKLYEKEGQLDKALDIYDAGMKRAMDKNDRHAFSELQGAFKLAQAMDDDDD